MKIPDAKDLTILTQEEFQDWYANQPENLQALIFAVARTIELAGVGQAVACNLVYNLLREGEIAALGRMMGPDSPAN